MVQIPYTLLEEQLVLCQSSIGDVEQEVEIKLPLFYLCGHISVIYRWFYSFLNSAHIARRMRESLSMSF